MLERGYFGGGNRLVLWETGSSLLGKRGNFGSKRGQRCCWNRVSIVLEKSNFGDVAGLTIEMGVFCVEKGQIW